MKKIIVLISICFSVALIAQNDEKIIFGAEVSADFGRLNNHVEISPTLYKRITSKIYAGVGLTVAYYNQKTTSTIYLENDVFELQGKTKNLYYGSSVFLRHYTFKDNKSLFLQNLYFQTELEILHGKSIYKDDFYNHTSKTKITTWFLGLGYKHRIKNRFSLTTSLVFKLNNQKNSPYKNPLFRVGFEL